MRMIVSRRRSMSRGVLAWPVESEPSCPVVIAWIMSSASPARHSPTTMRSGRMCSALRRRSRMVISPWPSRLRGTRLERHHVCLAELQLGRILDGDDALVLGDERGDDVEGRGLARACAPREEYVEARLDADSQELEHLGRGRAEPDEVLHREASGDLRTVMTGPTRESGLMMAFTREPSGRRASTLGLDSSICRPSGVMMRSMMLSTCSSSRKVMSTFSMRPAARCTPASGR